MLSAPQRLDVAAAMQLATLSLATSVLIGAGVVCSNDGSQYALIRALTEDGSPIIDRFVEYTRNVDYAQVGDHFYSDRPPGVALLAVPIYWLAQAFGLSDEARQLAVSSLAHVAGASATVLLFALARRLGASRAGAVFAALALAWCTPLRSYSSALFSHAFSAALLLGLLHCALPTNATPDRRRRALLLGGVLGGYATGIDYTNGLPVLVTCLCGSWIEARGDRHAALKNALHYLVGGLAGAAPALTYHTLVFGAPWAIPYHFDVNFEYAHTVGGMYGGNFLQGITGLLFDPVGGGLVVWSPVLVVGAWFVRPLARRVGERFWIVALPFAALFLVTCFNVTPEGGASRDVRYLSAVLPALCLPLALAFDVVLGQRAERGAVGRGRGAAKPVWSGVLWGAFFVSALLQAVKHNALWVRDGQMWIHAFADTLKTDAGPTLLGFLTWAYPHPIGAAAVLVVGTAAATALRWQAHRGEETEPLPNGDDAGAQRAS